MAPVTRATATPNGDTDSVTAWMKMSDNCPARLRTQRRTDTDGDGTGDACDSTPNGDTDGDGVDENARQLPSWSPTQRRTDTDLRWHR
jgi:hypothetical protein